MRKAETTPKKLLLLPLIPMLAFGIAAYVEHSKEIPIGVAAPTIVVVEHTDPAPVEPIVIERAPLRNPDDCPACVMSL